MRYLVGQAYHRAGFLSTKPPWFFSNFGLRPRFYGGYESAAPERAAILYLALFESVAVIEDAGAVKEQHIAIGKINEAAKMGGGEVTDIHQCDRGIALHQKRG